MAQIIEVPNYGQVEFPDDMSDEDIVNAIKKNAMGYKQPENKEPSLAAKAGQFISDALPKIDKRLADIKAGGLGIVSGIADIGQTASIPVNKLLDKVSPLPSGKTRSEDMQSRIGSVFKDSADTESGAFKGGELLGNILSTLPITGAAGNAVGKVNPMLGNAIKSGGMSLGGTTGSKLLDTGVRAAGGGVGGYLAAGSVNPEDANTGAAIGAALPPAVKLAGGLGSLAGKAVSETLGLTTGAGGAAVSEAFKSGQKGSTEFLDNIRGNSSIDDVVAKAKEGLAKMRLDRQSAYRSGMVDIKNDKSILDFTPIENAVKSVSSMGSFKGVQINKNASGVVDDVINKVDEWKALDPAEYHTPEGLDALKQAIGDIRDTTQPGTAARKAVDSVYNAVKDQITKQAPTYSRVMKDYSIASKELSNIQSALSLGEKAMPDTSVRKLQSVLRNNAQTNYGNRLNLVDELQRKGEIDLMPALAGQALNSWMPRGMVGAIEKVAVPYSMASNPAMAASIPFTMPRLVGEGAYKLGRLSGKTAGVLNAIAGNAGLAGGGALSLPPANYIPLSILAAQRVQQ